MIGAYKLIYLLCVMWNGGLPSVINPPRAIDVKVREQENNKNITQPQRAANLNLYKFHIVWVTQRIALCED